MFKDKSLSLLFFGSLSLGLGLCALALLWSASGPLSLAAPAATTWYVDATSGDNGNNCLSLATACLTISAAVDKAADGDIIQIAAGTYNEHDIEIFKQLTLNGAGIDSTIIDAGAAGRVFRTGSTVVISGLRMQNGQTGSGDLFTEGGGGVLTSGSLTLQNVALVDNHAIGLGGAIFNIGTLVLENTQVLSNTAEGDGGGIYNYIAGVITVTQSTLAYNTATGFYGGGIYAGGLALRVEDSTVADNSAGSFGGGITVIMNGPTVLDGVTLSGNQAASGAGLFSQQGTITATNTTVSGNNASNNYGGIYVSGAEVSLFLQNSTLAYNTRTNTAGNGFNGLMTGSDAVASLVNTILAYNQENNCSSFSPPTSLGHNLADDFTCGLTQSGDQPGVDPLLGTLADNGGPSTGFGVSTQPNGSGQAVQTHALLAGSPATDAGDDAQCPLTDARGIARPYDGDGDAVAVCDIGAVEAQHQLSIADNTVTEGDSGSVTAVFTVTLAPTSTTTVEVDYATVDETAAGGVDYTPVSDTLTFNPGEIKKVISVSVTGDTDDELNETFRVQLSAPVSADLVDGDATGAIVDDDGLPALSIADQTALEGNTGASAMQFEVTLSPPSASVVTVDYAAANGTASAGSDYTAAGGTLTFDPGDTSQTVSINALGDVVDEADSEDFTLQLSNPANAALADGQALGVILDDDTARISMGLGPQVIEGNSGATLATFDVTLSIPTAFTVTVDYATSDGYLSAIAGEDYLTATGRLTFAPGQTLQHIHVTVYGDVLDEPDEIFWLTLSNPDPLAFNANASSATILNDDGFAVFLPLVLR